MTRSLERRALVAREWPGVPTHGSLTELLAAGVDVVTITTPPATRRELVLEAAAAAVHMIADNPFAPTAAVGSDMDGTGVWRPGRFVARAFLLPRR